MMTFCAQDAKIASAIMSDTLTIEERFSDRLQQTYFAISNAFGLICVELTRQDAEARVESARVKLV